MKLIYLKSYCSNFIISSKIFFAKKYIRKVTFKKKATLGHNIFIFLNSYNTIFLNHEKHTSFECRRYIFSEI